MSKGGAGKVYFVLYLAVILELLIIIVERDEAEEHLIQKQKESMKIVESILSQLQSGSGSEGINTRPQDEITLQDPVAVKDAGATKIKQDRFYQVMVGVTDVSDADKMDGLEPAEREEKLRNLIRLANVQDLEYQVFYHSAANTDQSPMFPTDDSLRKARVDFTAFSAGQEIGGPVDNGRWQLMALRKVELQVQKTERYTHPEYSFIKDVGDVSTFAPPNARDSAFKYDQALSDAEAVNAGNKYKKRVFIVRFQPPNKAGWYKLRFASKTNRILGVKSEEGGREISPEEKVNIGTVQLKVKDLWKVKKTLISSLEGIPLPSADDLAAGKILYEDFKAGVEAAITKIKNESEANDPKAMEKIRRIGLYNYISILLTPGGSANIDQNRASIEFNVHVVQPPKRPDLDPSVYVDASVNTFDKLSRTEIPFTAGPYSPGRMPTVKSNPPLSWQVVDAGTGQVAQTAQGSAEMRKFKLVCNQQVQAGDYEIAISYANQSGKTKEEKSTLHVFASKLENEEDVKSIVENCYFGQELELLPVPSDGKKIPAGQYLIDAKITPQDQEHRGLQWRQEVPCGSKQISVDVLWEDPQTKERISLLRAPIQGSPKQRPPKIVMSDVKINPITDPRDPSVTVTNIKINAPIVDVGGAKAGPSDIIVLTPSVEKQDIPGYKVSAGPLKASGGGYEVELRLDGPPLKKGKVEGNVQLLVKAKAKNKCNGETSGDGKAIYNVPVSY